MTVSNKMALVQGSRRSLKLGAFVVGINGLAVEGQPPIETCAQVGQVLGTVKQSLQMAVGDFINWLELVYHEAASQVVDYEIFGDDRTVLVWRWVAEKVPIENRRLHELSFTHHQLVASLDVSQQAEWLNKAVERAWSSADLKAALKAADALPGKTKPVGYWLEVQCENSTDQQALKRRMETEGRACRIRGA